MKKYSLILATLVSLTAASAAIAGPNDFFGAGTPPGGQAAADNGGVGAITTPGSGGAGVDYTGDEKRMQKKLRANLQNARNLISKADDMIKTGKAKNDDKMVKKGKILKEIGERSLAELQASSPTPGKLPTEPDRTSNPNNL